MFGSVGRQLRQQFQDARGCQGLFFSQFLSTESVKAACLQLQHGFRERVYSPAITLWVFLSQVLSADHSCREAVARLNFWRVSRGLAPCNPDTGSYCEARMRLPEQLLQQLVRSTGKELVDQAPLAWHWLGRIVQVIDGSTLTMADTPENQSEYPQQAGQAAGAGFPIVRIVVVFSLAVGAVLDMAIGPYRGKQTGENNLFRRLLDSLRAGEVALADRYYASFWDFALLAERDIDLVARAHQLRKIDFRRGQKVGPRDQIVVYEKPRQCPFWMDQTTYARLPRQLRVRHLRYCVTQSGFRTRTITLATTLLDAECYTADELANLYRRRWQAELHLKSLKTHMQMEHLRCKKPATVRKEFSTYLLAYNLVRGILVEAALAASREPYQLSFKGAMQSLNTFLGLVIADSANAHRHYTVLLWMIGTHHVANRPNRIEPRLVKRRPKQYKHLKEPRPIARRRLLREGYA
jgi:putative transposase